MSTDPSTVPCPWCGRTNDAHRSLGNPGATPSDLDVSLCMTCGQFSLFCVHDDDGHVHLKRPPGGVGYAHVLSVLEGGA